MYFHHRSLKCDIQKKLKKLLFSKRIIQSSFTLFFHVTFFFLFLERDGRKSWDFFYEKGKN